MTLLAYEMVPSVQVFWVTRSCLAFSVVLTILTCEIAQSILVIFPKTYSAGLVKVLQTYYIVVVRR